MATQWRPGTSGVIGLCYESLPVILDLMRVKSRRRGDVFGALRAIEGEVLRVLAEDRKATEKG